MRLKLVSALAVFAFVSCNEIKEEDTIPTSKLEILTSLENVDDSVHSEENHDKLHEEANAGSKKILLIGRGTEPGWYAEFTKNHLRLLINNGEDSVHLDHDFSSINTEKTYKAAIVEKSNNNNIAIGITIENKECTEGGSGEKRDRYITVKYNNTLYKGCAEAKK